MINEIQIQNQMIFIVLLNIYIRIKIVLAMKQKTNKEAIKIKTFSYLHHINSNNKEVENIYFFTIQKSEDVLFVNKK